MPACWRAWLTGDCSHCAKITPTGEVMTPKAMAPLLMTTSKTLALENQHWGTLIVVRSWTYICCHQSRQWQQGSYSNSPPAGGTFHKYVHKRMSLTWFMTMYETDLLHHQVFIWHGCWRVCLPFANYAQEFAWVCIQILPWEQQTTKQGRFLAFTFLVAAK